MTQIEIIQNELEPFRQELIAHPLYKNIDSIPSVQTFMQIHIFAVWDFMSIVKSLQNSLSCTTIPWIPNKNTNSTRLINDIVLCEESDFNAQGVAMSHFEMYIEAMNQIEADTSQIDAFISHLQEGNDYKTSLDFAKVHEEIKNFLDFTFEVINTQKVHLVASVFTFGRENLIPDMYVEIIRKFNAQPNEDLSKLVYYLDRHIDVDGEIHGPMALEMINDLCADDQNKWDEAKEICKEALQRRIKLWDTINEAIVNKR